MVELIQVAVLFFALFAISRVLVNIRNRNISILESLFWAMLWLVVIFVSLFPEQLSTISELFGIQRAIDIVVYVGLIVLAYLIFRLYAKLRATEKNITKIVRTIAIKNEHRNNKTLR